MKKAVLAALIAAASFQAVGSEYVSDGWYIGADVMSTGLSVEYGNNGEDVSSVGFALNGGYSFELHESFVVGVEVDLSHYGEFDYKNTAVADVGSIGINIKPKYFVADSDFYLGGTLGFGYFLYNYDYQGKSYNTETDTTLVYGVEAGYAINQNWLLNLGYRRASPDFGGDVDFDFDSFYGGIEYKF